ncbi:hypothetical protein SJI18_23395 [Clostridium frigoriphilum]|uniref:Uncharacterized protein n=1 Tax=Clostridium frigoriphilum TaxID=443253 RepID=A0ABU7UUZ5_9CLOT|nr:hypothetical protein [Clostridium sp. DSM 17811]
MSFLIIEDDNKSKNFLQLKCVEFKNLYTVSLANEVSVFLESNVRKRFLPVNTSRKMNLNIESQGTPFSLEKLDCFKRALNLFF